jgi:glucan biosynthesis protein
MKKKQHWFEPYKKWAIGVILSIVVIPTLALSWHNIQAIWANPEATKKIEKKVMSHEELQDHLAKLVMEQSYRIEKNEQLDDMRAKNQAEQLALIAELKKS